MPYGCLCGGCRDCQRAQGYDPDADRIDELQEEVLNEWIADERFYSDFDASFSTETWIAIQRAIAQTRDSDAGALYRSSLREAMKDDARKAAAQRLKDQRRDAEEDRALARAGW